MPCWRYVCIYFYSYQLTKLRISSGGIEIVALCITLSCIGKFVQMDTIVYPRSAKSTSLVKLSRKRKSWSKTTPNQRVFPQIKVPHRSLLLTRCLEVHLQPILEVLMEGRVAEEHGIARVADQLISVLDLFMSRHVILNKSKAPVPWKDNAVEKVHVC